MNLFLIFSSQNIKNWKLANLISGENIKTMKCLPLSGILVTFYFNSIYGNNSRMYLELYYDNRMELGYLSHL